MEEKKMKKGPLEIDQSSWNAILSSKDDSPPPEIEVIGRKQRHHQQQQYVPEKANDIELMADHELNEKIKRLRQSKYFMSRLPDKGVKFLVNLKLHEDEMKRRIDERLKKDAECQPSAVSDSLYISGQDNCLRSEKTTIQASSQPSFAKRFYDKLEEKEQNLCQRENNDRDKTKVAFQRSSFQCPTSCCIGRRKNGGDEKAISCSSFYRTMPNGNSSNFAIKRSKASEGQTNINSRKRKSSKQTQTVVLVDEEDSQPTQETEQEDRPVAWKETKVYYPSRDDPECVELCHSDIGCLDPQAFLSSTIMNFYIRYLQRPISATGKSRSNYYFFNTYFYEKLKEAVTYKGDDEATFYVKFRRWWKGIDIFQKAYILLPIHESLHWSLAIICISAEEDESGPIILHLDSLGYHVSAHIFENVKRFLVKEWEYLKNQVDHTHLPIPERIWKRLPRRIEGKPIKVPQQRNDYDCGVFVLYYMERFIEEAPERVRREDLYNIFKSQWFKPEEASRLRGRIRKLLEEEFQNASIQNISRESSPASSDDSPQRCDRDACDSKWTFVE
ncbi:hypothetical protein Scep_017764 [Stephania cephalantha]|uniref:Ubiquitin-like protease family profile domain-containing protein n=1 Tax=Stephania cephalantha TaxID=152367 RepID=A0AAP0IS47_9MAGN